MTTQREVIVDLINRFSRNSENYLNEMIVTFEHLSQRIRLEGLTPEFCLLSRRINRTYAENIQAHLLRFRHEVTRVGIYNPAEYSEEERFAIINVEITMLESLVSAWKNLSEMMMAQLGE